MLIGSAAPHAAIASDAAAARLEEIRHNPAQLRQFLYQFPKGGDLHNHLDGAIYAESYIAWAAEDGKCIDLSGYIIVPPPCDVAAERPPASLIQFNADIVNPLTNLLGKEANYAISKRLP